MKDDDNDDIFDFESETVVSNSFNNKLFEQEYSSTSTSKILQTELVRLVSLDSNWLKLTTDTISNLYQWRITLTDFQESLLGGDLKKNNLDGILLELRFGEDFPFSPPFIRVVKPRLLRFIDGGGGHITAGGSVCMDLLTETGWNPAYSIESVLLQVNMALLNPDP